MVFKQSTKNVLFQTFCVSNSKEKAREEYVEKSKERNRVGLFSVNL